MFEKLTQSQDIEVRYQAISMLIGQHIGDQDYDNAQHFIDQLPNMTHDKLQQQGNLYIRMDQLDKAAELFENKLISTGTELFTILISMMEIALKENRVEDAKYFVKVLENINELFDFWDYNTHVAYFQLYIKLKDTENCLATLKKMLPAIRKKWDASASRLYTHIKTKETEDAKNEQFYSAFIDMLKNDSENDLDFIKNHPDFLELLNQ